MRAVPAARPRAGATGGGVRRSGKSRQSKRGRQLSASHPVWGQQHPDPPTIRGEEVLACQVGSPTPAALRARLTQLLAEQP